MIKRIIFLFIYLFFVQIVFAQKPWRAKLFVHFLDSNNKTVTDTIWFGLDTLGDVGLQEGLDLFDTTLTISKVLSHDSIIQNQLNTGCGNLKQNIKKMKYGETRFDFYAIGKTISMSWDTTDFLHDDIINKYFLSYAKLISYAGYIGNIDDNEFYLLSRYSGRNYIFRDSVMAFNESTTFLCGTNYKVFKFSLFVDFELSLKGVSTVELNKSFYVSPNPCNSFLNVNIDNENVVKFIRTKIYSVTGKLVKEILVENSTENIYRFDINELQEGIYFLTVEDKSGIELFHHKIIKSNL